MNRSYMYWFGGHRHQLNQTSFTVTRSRASETGADFGKDQYQPNV